MLIATLPEVHREDLCRKIVSHPLIDGVRYNTGCITPYSIRETIERILKLTNEYDKLLWIDLKCRQLRIVNWAAPQYGKIVLNHEIEVDYPAHVHFRGDARSELKVVQGNVIYVDPPPQNAVGAGQAVNIHGNNLKVKDFLTDQDKEYIKVAMDLGIRGFMFSFVEGTDDIEEIEIELSKHDCKGDIIDHMLKIESIKGVNFIKSIPNEVCGKYSLMAARDDLMINIGENKAMMLPVLKQIIMKDSNAILASHIFSGLKATGEATMADFSDLKLMHLMGYKNFMLSDEISQRYFDKAMKAWEDFQMVCTKVSIFE